MLFYFYPCFFSSPFFFFSAYVFRYMFPFSCFLCFRFFMLSFSLVCLAAVASLLCRLAYACRSLPRCTDTIFFDILMTLKGSGLRAGRGKNRDQGCGDVPTHPVGGARVALPVGCPREYPYDVSDHACFASWFP